MTLVRFDPFREMTVAQNRINHVLADAFAGAGSDTFGFLPPVDIRTGADHSLLIEVDLPGVPRDAVSVHIENRTLTIKGGEGKEDRKYTLNAETVITKGDKPATSEDIMQLLSELNAQGMTVVIVTHENDIADWARRKLVFRDGQIVQDQRQPGRSTQAVGVAA